MKQDIREVFKKEQLPKKKLPDFHEDEFLEKLKKFNKKKISKPFFQIRKIAVSIVLIISVGYYLLNVNSEKNSTLFAQIKQIEKEHLQNIDTEWNAFVSLTTDKKLIKKYEEKLLKLDINYKEVSLLFEKNPNNINILELLINNLQTRLQLIKSIKEHLKELNQKSTSNETIYL
mgnify:CR=1 FL=1